MRETGRKPLRRTAWSMLLGGLVVAGVMLGVGVLAVGQGEPAGPGQVARWPADTEIAVFRPVGRQADGGSVSTVACTVGLPDGRTERLFPRWADRLTADFSGPATITCERPVMVLSGTRLTVAGIVRGPLIALPLFVAILGVLLFVPRFTRTWAGLTQPLGRWITRRFDRDRP